MGRYKLQGTLNPSWVYIGKTAKKQNIFAPPRKPGKSTLGTRLIFPVPCRFATTLRISEHLCDGNFRRGQGFGAFEYPGSFSLWYTVFCRHNTGIKYRVLLNSWYLVYRHKSQFFNFQVYWFIYEENIGCIIITLSPKGA